MSGALAKSVPTREEENGAVVGDDIDLDIEDDDSVSIVGSASVKDGQVSEKKSKAGKKRGNIFKCESCSKVCANFLHHESRELTVPDAVLSDLTAHRFIVIPLV